MTRALIEKEFIARAIRIHGKRYDYSKVYYENNKTKVTIICTNHEQFWQRPGDHLKGNACPTCSSNLNQIINSLRKQ